MTSWTMSTIATHKNQRKSSLHVYELHGYEIECIPFVTCSMNAMFVCGLPVYN